MCVLSASVVTRAGLEAVAARGVALQLFAEVNNTSGGECEVTLRSARCCLAGDRRCDVLQLAGGVTETVPPGMLPHVLFTNKTTAGIYLKQ